MNRTGKSFKETKTHKKNKKNIARSWQRYFSQNESVFNITFNNAKCVKLHSVLCVATGSNERVIIVRPRWKQLRARQSAVMKKRIFLSALTNRSADAIGVLIPKCLLQPPRYLWVREGSEENFDSLLVVSYESNFLPCLWLSKSSMKSAPLALQRGANEANGRISDAWYCKIRLNYVTFTPSYSHPFNILVPCRYWLISPLSTRHWQSQTSSAISLLRVLILSLWSNSFSFHPWMLQH